MFDGPASGIVKEEDVHASPEVPLFPFAVRTAMSTLVDPLPVVGAVQSKDHERVGTGRMGGRLAGTIDFDRHDPNTRC